MTDEIQERKAFRSMVMKLSAEATTPGAPTVDEWFDMFRAAGWGPTGDEHHTMEELYQYRMLYNAHAAQGWLLAGIPVVRSWRHSDGEECFGGGWFIVVADLPGIGPVSNHYPERDWILFSFVPEVELAPKYDGHTPALAAERLEAGIFLMQQHVLRAALE